MERSYNIILKIIDILRFILYKINMSKKNKEKDNVVEKDPMTKGEKIFYGIVALLGIIAIIIVIIVFALKGKPDPIANEYEYLEEGHMVVEINYDQFIEYTNNKDDFQLILGNNELEDAKYYVYYANELSVEYNVEKLYYLNTNNLDSNQKTYFKQDLGLTNKIFNNMNLIYFENGVVSSQTFSGDIEEYGNCWEQLVSYFKECYGEIE